MHEHGLLRNYNSRSVPTIQLGRGYTTRVVCSSTMPRRTISQFNRVRLVSLCQKGLSTRDVCRRHGVKQSDVVRTWRRYRETGTFDDMPRSGRSRATTAVVDRYLRISARRNPDSYATMLNNAFCAETGRRITTQTVGNTLHDAQLHSRLPW